MAEQATQHYIFTGNGDQSPYTGSITLLLDRVLSLCLGNLLFIYI